MTITLGDLTTMVIEQADFVSSSYIPTSEVVTLINQSGHELHGILVSKFEDYRVSPVASTFSITGSQNTNQLPADFLKLRGVDFNIGGAWIPLRTFTWEERGTYTAFTIAPDVTGDYRFWYVPKWADLVNTTDQLGYEYVDYHELLVVGAAIKLLEKEESSEDAKPLLQRKAELVQRIVQESSDQDASNQLFATDVTDMFTPWRRFTTTERRYRIFGRYLMFVAVPDGW